MCVCVCVCVCVPARARAYMYVCCVAVVFLLLLFARQGRQKKRWEDNTREWTGQEFAKSQRAEESRENGGSW